MFTVVGSEPCLSLDLRLRVWFWNQIRFARILGLKSGPESQFSGPEFQLSNQPNRDSRFGIRHQFRGRNPDGKMGPDSGLQNAAGFGSEICALAAQIWAGTRPKRALWSVRNSEPGSLLQAGFGPRFAIAPSARTTLSFVQRPRLQKRNSVDSSVYAKLPEAIPWRVNCVSRFQTYL